LSFRIGPPRVTLPILREVSGLSPALAQLRARRESFSKRNEPPVEVVGAGLREDGDRGAPCHPLLGVEAAGRDADRVHRVGGSHVHGVVGQPDVDVRGAVEAGVVVVAGGAVDVRGERPGGRVGDGVLEPRGCRPRHEVEELLVVTVVPERQVLDLLGLELALHGAGVGLQQRRLRLDGDGLRHRADLERDVHAGDRVGRDRDAFLDGLLEARQDDADPVGPGDHVDERVAAVGAGGGLTREVRTRVDGCHGRTGHRGVGRVGDAPMLP
jgi:hypothetical protein